MPRTALVPAIAIAALLLSGCGGQPESASSESPETATPKPTETVEPTPEALQLPADAVLGMSMHATAENGAELDILLVLLKPESIDAPAAAGRADATLDWCEGEIDESILVDGDGFSFAQLDATVTQVAGTAAWPADLPLHLLPSGDGGPTMTPGGSAYAVERPSDNAADDPGYYVPHCLQDAFVPAPGTGSVYLGFQGDATTLDDWATSYYGATFDLFGEPIGDPRATFTDCTTVITELGTSMGGSETTLPNYFSATQCRAGDGSAA